MGSDLKGQLEGIFGSRVNPTVAPLVHAVKAIPCSECGDPAPDFFEGSIVEAFARYTSEYHNHDFEDRRGISVSLLDDNFVKLISMQHRPHPNADWQRARAKAVIPALRNGTFKENQHRSEEPIRLRTLFWIHDVIHNSHGIHPNCAKLVEGEEVYFKRFDKGVADVKLVFTTIRQGGLRVIVTSFLCQSKNLHKYCAMPPLHPK